MPREDFAAAKEGKAPAGNHLGILRRDGTVDGVPEGALVMMMDHDVGHPITFALMRISTKAIVLGLVGQDGKVSTEYTYKVSAGKPLTRDAYIRMKKEGKVR